MKYRVGKSTKRSVLNSDGTLVVMFEEGMEQLAQEFVNFLNNKQMKYTAEQIRNERISIECDNREQALKLQAHFHKLYPNDGYTSIDVGKDKQYLRFYKILNNPFGWMDVSFLYISNQSSKEIHFNDFDFEDGVKDSVVNNNVPKHYDNSKGSLYLFAEQQGLNAWEFEVVKRIVRCRRKGEFMSDITKTIEVLNIYLKEQGLKYEGQIEKLNK